MDSLALTCTASNPHPSRGILLQPALRTRNSVPRLSVPGVGQLLYHILLQFTAVPGTRSRTIDLTGYTWCSMYVRTCSVFAIIII